MRQLTLFTLLLSVVLVGIANADTFNQNPYDDATGFDGSVSPFVGPIKDGLFDSLNAIGDLQILSTATVDARMGLLFDISSIPDDSTIQGAILRLTETVDPGLELRLDGYAGGNAVTLADMSVSNPLGTQTSDGSAGIIDFDVTGFLQSLLGSGQDHAGFLLRDMEESGLFYSTASREATDAGTRPQLIVDFATVPEPGTLVVWMTGGLGLLLLQSLR